MQRQYLTQVQGLHNELQTAQRQFSEQLSQERASKDQELETLRRELAGKAQLAREQANDLQENARMHRAMHENEQARVHETLAAQAEQWKIHCDALTQQCDAGMAEYAERIAELEREIEELSGKYIETSEKLEQWDLWWQESGTQVREAETSGLCPEGLETIAEEERRPQSLHLYSLSLLFRRSFCRRLFHQSSLRKIARKWHIGAKNPAIPVWIQKPYPHSQLQLLRRVRPNIHRQL